MRLVRGERSEGVGPAEVVRVIRAKGMKLRVDSELPRARTLRIAERVEHIRARLLPPFVHLRRCWRRRLARRSAADRWRRSSAGSLFRIRFESCS